MAVADVSGTGWSMSTSEGSSSACVRNWHRWQSKTCGHTRECGAFGIVAEITEVILVAHKEAQSSTYARSTLSLRQDETPPMSLRNTR